MITISIIFIIIIMAATIILLEFSVGNPHKPSHVLYILWFISNEIQLPPSEEFVIFLVEFVMELSSLVLLRSL